MATNKERFEEGYFSYYKALPYPHALLAGDS
jgi:hypothetical protein